MGASVLVLQIAGPQPGTPSPHCSELSERLVVDNKATTYYNHITEAFLFLMFFAWLIARCSVAVAASKCMVEIGGAAGIEAYATRRVTVAPAAGATVVNAPRAGDTEMGVVQGMVNPQGDGPVKEKYAQEVVQGRALP